MATLQYDFRVVGINSVMAAFRSLERRAMEHNRKVDQMFGGGRGGGGGARSGGMRAGGAGQQADAHVREFKRVRDVRAKNDASVLREETRKNKEWINFKNRLNNERLKAENDHAKKQVDIARRMENDRIKEVKKASKERERIALKSYAAARSKAARRYDAGVGALTSLGSAAAGAIALGGGALIASGVRSELRLGKSAALLAGLSRQAGARGDLKATQEGIVGRAREVGKQTGMDREAIVGGMSSFFGVSGELDAAKTLAPLFADISQITGASMEDIGKAAGTAYMQAMASQMTPKDAEKATEDILRAFAGQSARGNINMEDYVRLAPSLLTTAGRFGGDYGKTAALVSAIGQTSPLGGATSAAEAATSLSRFADTLRDQGGKGGAFEKAGVKTFEQGPNGPVMRDPMQIIREVLLRTKGGDERELGKFGFNVRGMRAVTGFNRIYRQAEAKKPGSGIAAVDAHLKTFMNANVSPKMQKELTANLRSTPAMQFEAAMNDLKDEVGKSLLPALTKLAPQMGKLATALEPVIGWLGKFVESLADNPWGTIIDAMKIAIVGSIAKQAIGEAIRAQIIKMISGGGLPGAPGTPGAPPVIPSSNKFGPDSMLARFATLYGFYKMVQMRGDQPEILEDDDPEMGPLQEERTALAKNEFRRKREMHMGKADLVHENIPAADIIRYFGKSNAMDLGLIDKEGKVLDTKEMGKPFIAKETEKAAQMLQESAKALQNAAASMGAGGLFGSLFGGLNRGTSPQEPTPSSGGR